MSLWHSLMKQQHVCSFVWRGFRHIEEVHHMPARAAAVSPTDLRGGLEARLRSQDSGSPLGLVGAVCEAPTIEVLVFATPWRVYEQVIIKSLGACCSRSASQL